MAGYVVYCQPGWNRYLEERENMNSIGYALFVCSLARLFAFTLMMALSSLSFHAFGVAFISLAERQCSVPK